MLRICKIKNKKKIKKNKKKNKKYPRAYALNENNYLSKVQIGT